MHGQKNIKKNTKEFPWGSRWKRWCPTGAERQRKDGSPTFLPPLCLHNLVRQSLTFTFSKTVSILNAKWCTLNTDTMRYTYRNERNCNL